MYHYGTIYGTIFMEKPRWRRGPVSPVSSFRRTPGQDMKFTDLVMCAGDDATELHCHRAVLAKSSEVFDRMLSRMARSVNGEIMGDFCKVGFLMDFFGGINKLTIYDFCLVPEHLGDAPKLDASFLCFPICFPCNSNGKFEYPLLFRSFLCNKENRCQKKDGFNQQRLDFPKAHTDMLLTINAFLSQDLCSWKRSRTRDVVLKNGGHRKEGPRDGDSISANPSGFFTTRKMSVVTWRFHQPASRYRHEGRHQTSGGDPERFHSASRLVLLVVILGQNGSDLEV